LKLSLLGEEKMNIYEILMNVPPYCYIIALVISIIYGVRAIIYYRAFLRENKDDKVKNPLKANLAERIIVYYIQEFLFHFITSMSGFVALFIAWNIFPSKVDDISIGKALVLIFLFVWGVIGTGGYLTLLISTGKINPTDKLPGMDKGNG
jgi:hypothetical protein